MSWAITETFHRAELETGQVQIAETIMRKFFDRRTVTDGVEEHTFPAIIEGQLADGTALEAFAQVSTAVQQVNGLLGALGNDWLKIVVVLSGHANPHGKKRAGYGGESVGVHVSVVEYIQPEYDDGEQDNETAGASPALQVVGHD